MFPVFQVSIQQLFTENLLCTKSTINKHYIVASIMIGQLCFITVSVVDSWSSVSCLFGILV